MASKQTPCWYQVPALSHSRSGQFLEHSIWTSRKDLQWLHEVEKMSYRYSLLESGDAVSWLDFATLDNKKCWTFYPLWFHVKNLMGREDEIVWMEIAMKLKWFHAWIPDAFGKSFFTLSNPNSEMEFWNETKIRIFFHNVVKYF